jgi:ribosomal protein S18 acetylase RimI-like enzyme
MNDEYPFPLVERFLSIRLDIDLSAAVPGRLHVVESPRRLREEASYGYLRVLWWLRLLDGREIVSVPPGAGEAVTRLLSEAGGGDPTDPAWAERLCEPVNGVLRAAGLKPVNITRADLRFACDGESLCRHAHGDCRRLSDERIPPAKGMLLPTHCFPDGIVYGVIADGRVAAVAISHRTGIMEDTVADLGVVTAPAYRRRGFAQTVVSAVAAHVIDAGGEAIFACAPQNAASAATAHSVGFQPIGSSLMLGAPLPL